jgi:predicted phage terminase large subunit-like protein
LDRRNPPRTRSRDQDLLPDGLDKAARIAAEGRADHQKHRLLGIPQDPAQAGNSQAQYLIRQLSGFDARARIERGEKPLRFSPFSAQCEAGNVKILRAPWNTALFENLEAFPDADHDDTADACSGAFNMLQTGTATAAPLRM